MTAARGEEKDQQHVCSWQSQTYCSSQLLADCWLASQARLQALPDCSTQRRTLLQQEEHTGEHQVHNDEWQGCQYRTQGSTSHRTKETAHISMSHNALAALDNTPLTSTSWATLTSPLRLPFHSDMSSSSSLMPQLCPQNIATSL